VTDTDRQTDIQNYNSQDRASIAASRGKNRFTFDKEMSKVFTYSVNAVS